MARIMPELEFRSFHSHRSCEIMPNTTRLATLPTPTSNFTHPCTNHLEPSPIPNLTPVAHRGFETEKKSNRRSCKRVGCSSWVPGVAGGWGAGMGAGRGRWGGRWEVAAAPSSKLRSRPRATAGF